MVEEGCLLWFKVDAQAKDVEEIQEFASELGCHVSGLMSSSGDDHRPRGFFFR